MFNEIISLHINGLVIIINVFQWEAWLPHHFISPHKVLCLLIISKCLCTLLFVNRLCVCSQDQNKGMGTWVDFSINASLEVDSMALTSTESLKPEVWILDALCINAVLRWVLFNVNKSLIYPQILYLPQMCPFIPRDAICSNNVLNCMVRGF